VNWARDNQWKGRISAFAMLLAAFTFLYFMSVIHGVLASAESRIRASAPLGRVAFAGALTGIAGMAMALVTMAAASSDGGNVDPAVTKAVTTGAAGPFMVAAMGFAAFLMAAGLVTLRNPSLRPVDRGRRAHRRRVIPHHVPGSPRRDDRREPIRLRVLPRCHRARHLDGSRKPRHLPLSVDLVGLGEDSGKAAPT
jgi:hypothetical protein